MKETERIQELQESVRVHQGAAYFTEEGRTANAFWGQRMVAISNLEIAYQIARAIEFMQESIENVEGKLNEK